MEKAIVIKIGEREGEKGKCSLRWKAKCIGSGGSRVYEVTVPVRNKGL